MWTIHGHDSFENSKGENAKCCPPLPHALSIKGDVTLGTPHSRLLGQKWRCISVEQPSAGKSVTNPALESALVRTDLTGKLSEHIYAPDPGSKLPS